MRALPGWFFIVCLCAAQADENTVAVHSELAHQAQQRGDFKAAAQEWQAVVQLLPGVAEANSNLGMMWHFDQQYPNAIKAFLKAVALNPDLIAPHLFLGIDYYLTSRPAEAIAQLTEATRLDSRNPIAMKWLGMSYLQLGDCQKALNVLNSARELDPRDADLLYSLSRTYAKLLFQSYDALRRQDPNSPFLKALQGGAPTTLRTTTDSSLARIRATLESGKGSEAFQQLSEFIQRVPENAEYRYWFAKCSEMLALKYLDAFFAQSPGSYRVHQLKAEYFLAVNDEEQAIREYREAISMKPNAVQLHADLGNLFMVHHEYRRAIEEYQAELRANPYSLQALERIGQAYVELHEAGNAINYLNRAIAIDPRSFEALRALGQVSYQRAAYQEAAARFHAAWAAKPEGDSTVAYQLVQTYRKLGNEAEMQRWSAELQHQLAKDLAKAQQNLSTTAPSHNTR